MCKDCSDVKQKINTDACGVDRTQHEKDIDKLRGNLTFLEAFPDHFHMWNSKKNKYRSPGSAKVKQIKRKYVWNCECGKEFCCSIPHLVHNKWQCDECKEKESKKWIREHSVALFTPQIAAMWDYEKNELAPEEVTIYDTNEFWFTCIHDNHDSYKMNLQWKIASEVPCPYCDGSKILPGFNDFGTLHPDALRTWDYDKNDSCDPREYGSASSLSFNWKCFDCGYEWRTSIASRVRSCGCPKCTGNMQTSFPEQAILYYVSKYFKAFSRHKIDKKEIDIWLPELNTGIEYNGRYWHKIKADKTAKDKQKQSYFADKGITLLTIADGYNKNQYRRDTKTIYIKKQEHDLTWAITRLFHLLDVEVPDIDLKRDEQTIKSQYLPV